MVSVFGRITFFELPQRAIYNAAKQMKQRTTPAKRQPANDQESLEARTGLPSLTDELAGALFPFSCSLKLLLRLDCIS